jgi:hypothetical protein
MRSKSKLIGQYNKIQKLHYLPKVYIFHAIHLHLGKLNSPNQVHGADYVVQTQKKKFASLNPKIRHCIKRSCTWYYLVFRSRLLSRVSNRTHHFGN